MASRQPPEQHAPPVQRLRVKYAKRGRARFASHRDFGRAFERALRRAGVPMAYSSGFSPHPRISYANASPTGAASEAEYLEIGLTEACNPDRIRLALDAALPEGLDIVNVTVAAGGALADELTGSRWRVQVAGVPAEVMARAVATLLAATEAPVSRMTKSGLRTFDARGAVMALQVDGSDLVVVLRHEVPLVRPDDVLTALGHLDDQWLPSAPALLSRERQGRLDDDGIEISEPL